MNTAVNPSSRELETEAAASRARLSGALDQLASNLTPGRVLDEVMSYSRSGGADFLRGLRNAATANPIPTLLIGAGCAMFLSGKGRQTGDGTWWGMVSPRSAASPPDDRDRRPEPKTAKGAISGLKEGAASMASSLSGAVGERAASLGEAASRWRDSAADSAHRLGERGRTVGATMGDYAGEARERLSEQASETQQQMTEQARRMGEQALSKSRELSQKAASFVEEQPLVVAAGGFLLGAAVAALLPKTEIEDGYLGEASDAVKETVGNAATEQLQQTRAAATEVVDKVKDAARQEGLSTESVEAAADKLENVAKAGSEAVKAGTDRVLKG